MVDRAAQLADDACEVEGVGLGDGYVYQESQRKQACPDVPEFIGGCKLHRMKMLVSFFHLSV